MILTGLGKRLQPMLVSISTATSNNTGIGKQLWNYTIKVLDGVIDDERFFGVIYAADEDDDPWSERTMRKANPGWGITVVPEQIHMIARQAKAQPGAGDHLQDPPPESLGHGQRAVVRHGALEAVPERSPRHRAV